MMRFWMIGMIALGWLGSNSLAVGNEAPNSPEKMILNLGNGVTMEFVLIRAGKFQMGSEKGESDEQPLHEVTITRDFWMQATETTQAQWEAVLGENPSHFQGPLRPVESVSWEDAQEFLRRLNERVKRQLEGKIATLPTEAEWEYACRAGQQTQWYFGDSNARMSEYAWHKCDADERTHTVGEKKANPWGLYDMHGNVSEWCEDRYGIYSSDSVTDPTGPGEGVQRVNRGGSISSNDDGTRSAKRAKCTPNCRKGPTGLRPVLRSSLSYLESGKKKCASGDYDGAIVDFTKAIEIDPRFADAYDARGMAKLSKGDDGAFADLTKAIELNPQSSIFYVHRAGPRIHKRDYDGAIVDYTKAIELDPKSAWNYHLRGVARMHREDFNGAITDFTQAVQMDPACSVAYGSRGWAHFRRDSWDQALADLRRACERESSLSQLDRYRLNIWLCRARIGEREAATQELAEYVQARALKEEGKQGNYVELLLFFAGQLSEADLLKNAEAGEVGLKRRHRIVDTYYYAGFRRLVEGDSKTAKSYFQKCVDTNEWLNWEVHEAQRMTLRIKE